MFDTAALDHRLSVWVVYRSKNTVLAPHALKSKQKGRTWAETLYSFEEFHPSMSWFSQVVHRINWAVMTWLQSRQTQPCSVFSWLLWPCQALLQSESLSSRVEVDMIAFKQPLLASDTQLQSGTSSDSKSTMMDCLAKTADQRRLKIRCVSGCTRRVQSSQMAFPVQIS